jgi:hypothetical protein
LGAEVPLATARLKFLFVTNGSSTLVYEMPTGAHVVDFRLGVLVGRRAFSIFHYSKGCFGGI